MGASRNRRRFRFVMKLGVDGQSDFTYGLLRKRHAICLSRTAVPQSYAA